MDRRTFVGAVACSLLASSLAALAQQEGKIWRIGVLWPGPASPPNSRIEAFRQGLRELGYVEGRNVEMVYRYAEGDYARLPALAADLVRLKVDVILGAGAPAVGAAQRATTTIPIVIGTAGDPVGTGFARSLARPGGNITGLSDLSSDLGSKLLDLLIGTVPRLSRVGVLTNPGNSSHGTILVSIQSAASSMGVTIVHVTARSADEINGALSKLAQEKVGAVIATADPLFNVHTHQIAESAARLRLPTISGYLPFAEDGGMMSYGPDFSENFRRAATYVDKILKGANPGDLPIEQVTRVSLMVNRKIAQSLGVTVPQSILLRADRVIE
jgi:putative tryptophan/tyrosine transport system substrate-binding protein